MDIVLRRSDYGRFQMTVSLEENSELLLIMLAQNYIIEDHEVLSVLL